MNDIAILDRSFLDMELLKPIFSATALVGIHIGRPFLSLLLDNDTNYDTLCKAFITLYNDLTNKNIARFLQTRENVCGFVSDVKFRNSLPKNCLLQSLDGCITQYNKEILKLMAISSHG